MPLFDSDRADQAKQRGMEQAALSRAEALQVAKEIAWYLGRTRPEVDVDMVQREFIRLGHLPEELGNAAGSIFKGSEWEWTGKRKKSVRISNHSRWVMVWRLKQRKEVESYGTCVEERAG
jgi:hypothetical protein